MLRLTSQFAARDRADQHPGACVYLSATWGGVLAGPWGLNAGSGPQPAGGPASVFAFLSFVMIAI